MEGRVATVAVLPATDAADEANAQVIGKVRQTAAHDLPAPLRAEATGGPAFRADVAGVFAGADAALLMVTASVVAVLLLLLTYRSPVL